MKNTVRMILTLLLTMILYLCLIPSAFGEGETIVASGTCGAEGDNLTWTLYDNGELVIEGTGGMANYGEGSAPWYKNRLDISTIDMSDGITRIGAYAFCYCINVESINISKDVLYINNYAFQGCTSLLSVIIPESTREIGAAAFYGCTNLNELLLPDGLEGIGNYAFCGCEGIKKIFLPNSLTRMDYSAFQTCLGLTEVTIPGGVERIGSASFSNCSNLKTVHILEGVTIIESGAFSGCSKLERISIPNSVTIIGPNVFSNCKSLQTITIPDSVNSLGRGSFYKCTGLKTINIPDNVTSIDEETFYGCINLNDVYIPDSVTNIGYGAFWDCTSLADIEIPKGVVSIEKNAFRNCTNLASFSIPEGVVNVGDEAFSGCYNLTGIYVDDNNSAYCDIDGVLFDKAVTTIIYFPRTWEGTYNIPSTVTNIGQGTFSDCRALTGIVIPNGVTSIEYSSFYNCSSLISLIIPASISKIQSDAFSNCDQLTVICFSGTQEQWNNIPKGYSNFPLQNAKIYYNCVTSDVYTITLYSNDNTDRTQTQVVPGEMLVQLDISPFVRDGYVFIGWSTTSEGPAEYSDGHTLTVTQNMPLYAQWAEAITITFDGNGGNYNSWMDDPTQIVPKGIPTPLKDNIFTRSNYTFKGWGLSAGDRSVDYQDRDIVTLNENITLYAIWEEIERIGSFSVEGGESTGFGWTYCVGDTLTASVSTTSPKTYQWNRDGKMIPGANQKTYLVTPEDYLHRISCTVQIPTDTQTSSSVTVNVNVQQEIIDDGDTSLPYGAPGVIKGVFPGMTYTVNRGQENTIPDTIQNNRLEVTEPGTYVFRYNNLESSPVSVDAWYSIGYTVKSNSGAGTVRLMYGSTNLSGSEVREDGITIIRRYYGENVYGNCWLVRKDAASDDFTLTVIPSSSCYAHVSVNGGEINSFDKQKSFESSVLSAPVLYEISFTASPLNPNLITAIDENTFPDPVFRSYVSRNYDRDGDGMLSDSEIYSVRHLSCSNYGFASLKGIEYFTEITSIYCSSNNLTELDLSGCTALTDLTCNANSLQSLNLNGCTGLRSLNCANNSLRELDVSGCQALETLNCSTNMLSGLDLSSNSALMSLTCSDNYFTLLSLAENPVLNTLTCNDNLLKRLDLSLNPSLVSLICTGNILTGLDVSDCPNLRTLRCGGNLLTWLNLSGCPSIMTLDCSGNSIETLILDGCTALTSLNCSNNRLQALALDSAASLNSLSCSANQLELLDVSGLGNLTVLNCQSNQIAEIDVSDCGTLRSLNCTNNLLRQLDVTGCYSMKALQCERNLLTALDLGGCEVLKTLYCSNNGLTQLDISDCPALIELVESTEPQERGTTLVYGAYGTITSSSSSSVPSYSLGLSIDKNVVLIYPSHSIAADPDFVLPSSLTVIDSEAFSGGAFKYVMLPEGVKTIGWRAFADCPNLLYIYIPASIENIDAHAFDGEDRLTIIGVPGSEAETYARLHGFAFTAVE